MREGERGRDRERKEEGRKDIESDRKSKGG